MTETDAVLNAETRRALREWGRRLYALGAGVLTAVVMLIPITVTTIRSVGMGFHLAVTLVVSLSLPITAGYMAVRAYGLSHRDVLYAGKQAYREGVAEAIALSGTGRTVDVFGESESGTGEAAESPSPNGMETNESSTESEPTDPQQHTNPEPNP